MGLAQAGSAEMRRKLARDKLEHRGIELRRAHKTAIDALVAFESDRQTTLLRIYDDNVEQLLHIRTDGRPNKHSVLRDLLIFAQQHLMQHVGQLQARDARKRTAQMFGLTSDTKFARTWRPSIEQVRRAEERTLGRFALLQKVRGGGELLSLAWFRAVYVLGFYISELNDGVPLDAEAFHADATWLISLCRTLDAFERMNRIEKTAAREAERRLTHQPGKAAPSASVN